MEERISRILIVDDNVDIHEDIKQILNPLELNSNYSEIQKLKTVLFGEKTAQSEAGYKPSAIRYQIDDAYQGDDGVEKVRRAIEEGYPYSLIFMDVRMPPGMDGIQTIKKIWEIQPYVEVVICTAYSDYSWEEILAEFQQTDHLLFIKKPFDSVSLKQLALALTTKWRLEYLNRNYIDNLETEVKKRTQELAYLANYDPLTKLLNRHSFYQALDNIIKQSSKFKPKQPFYLLFMDIDGFKQVNDFFGHDIGDCLLHEISTRVKRVLMGKVAILPEVCNPNEKVDAIFRLGGDEFTAIVNVNNINSVEKLAIDLVESIKQKYIIMEHEINIACSVGISIFPEDSEDGKQLLKYADLAMYRAKETGGVFLFFDKMRDSGYFQQLALETDMKNILNNDQIKLEYQGLMNNKDQLIGIEALIRWNHPQLGLLKPDDFIAIAEKSNLVLKIGEFVLRTACQQLKEIHYKGHKLFVLVNCTVKQFYDPNFINLVTSVLKETNLVPKYLKLGLEENSSWQNLEKSIKIIYELDRIGVQLTVDGLCRGNSLFNFLQKLPQNTLVRIDKKYVNNIVNSNNDQKFLSVMLDLIKSRNLNAIISGIETAEQKKILSANNCIFQGFYFDKPQSFTELLKKMSL